MCFFVGLDAWNIIISQYLIFIHTVPLYLRWILAFNITYWIFSYIFNRISLLKNQQKSMRNLFLDMWKKKLTERWKMKLWNLNQYLRLSPLSVRTVSQLMAFNEFNISSATFFVLSRSKMDYNQTATSTTFVYKPSFSKQLE